jgi:hypothetical protein
MSGIGRLANRYRLVAAIGAVACLSSSTIAEPADSLRPAVKTSAGQDDALWKTAHQRGAIYADCARSTRRLLQGWIEEKRDPQTNLYSRGRAWDYHDEAADHYSSLIFMAHYVDPALLQPEGSLHQTLLSSQRLCATESGLPTTFDLAAQRRGKIATYKELAEWLRDGLIRIVEVLGTQNEWYRETERLTDAILADAARRGGIARVLTGHEEQGNMLQALARLHALSGNAKYLQAAEQIADTVLPQLVEQAASVRVQDHGCELVPGLAELFVLECQLQRPAAKTYREPLRRLLDRVLADYAHPTSGLFCQSATDASGQRVWPRPTDTWGYILFAHENYDRATGEGRYTAAIEKPLRWLAENRGRYDRVRATLWPQSQSSDDWSDSYESMIILWNRYPCVAGVFEWLDWATLQHVHRRANHPRYGPFTGGHFDGSTGRTLCLHMMFCSQGVRCLPFAEGLRLGAVPQGDALLLTIDTDTPWRGQLYFDGPRNKHRAATIDWARINEMPQWFVVRPEERCQITVGGSAPRPVDGATLIGGWSVECQPGAPCLIRVTRHRDTGPRAVSQSSPRETGKGASS